MPAAMVVHVRDAARIAYRSQAELDTASDACWVRETRLDLSVIFTRAQRNLVRAGINTPLGDGISHGVER